MQQARRREHGIIAALDVEFVEAQNSNAPAEPRSRLRRDFGDTIGRIDVEAASDQIFGIDPAAAPQFEDARAARQAVGEAGEVPADTSCTAGSVDGCFGRIESQRRRIEGRAGDIESGRIAGDIRPPPSPVQGRAGALQPRSIPTPFKKPRRTVPA